MNSHIKKITCNQEAILAEHLADQVEQKALEEAMLAEHLAGQVEQKALEEAMLAEHFADQAEQKVLDGAMLAKHFADQAEQKALEEAMLAEHLAGQVEQKVLDEAMLAKHFADQAEQKAHDEAMLAEYLSQMEQGEIRSSIENNIRKEQSKKREAEYLIFAEKIRVEERNLVISELSHHIKNLNATVREPLENLRNQPGVPENILEDALRGTNLIRNIVNAMNLSIGGAREDFIFDATHLDDESVSLDSIIWSALFSAIPNMFDGKHFSKFLRNYFPSRETFRAAQDDWAKARAEGNREKQADCLRRHLFDLSVEISGEPELILGDTKGSATKMLILCQEIMMNAVKYASTMEREKREIRIHVSQSPETVSIVAENSCNMETRLKTAGIGHTVIKNFAEILGCEPQISQSSECHSLSLEFDNFSHMAEGEES